MKAELSDWDLQLCKETFSLWSGKCSAILVWMFPPYFLLTLVSVYFMAKQQSVPFILCYNKSLNIRAKVFLSAILLVFPIVNLLISYFKAMDILVIDYVSTFIQSFCWLIHLGYLNTLPMSMFRGHQCINILYLLCLASSGYNLHVTIVSENFKNTGQYTIVIPLIVQVLYVGTFFPKFECIRFYQGSSFFSSSDEEHESFPGSSLQSSYSCDMEIGPNSLGVGEKCGILSRIFFCWVKSLMVKGFRNLIHSSNDLYKLPLSLQARYISYQIQAVNKNVRGHHAESHSGNITSSKTSAFKNFGLLFALHQSFGLEYYILGVLKFLSDCLSFSGPMLLNVLVKFLESGKTLHYNGYLYALALLTVTFINSLISTHYSYLVSRVGLKVRSALILTIYQKTLNVSRSMLLNFSTGEVVNFMSTDTDRIVNFCPSFHQFWSLPFQVAIALYLLYSQVGFSFLIGLIFAILIIPLNQLIARKIGFYSKLMMNEKDKRIKLMNEVLNGMKGIKMQALETTFSEKIKQIRQKELSWLRKRKYLDAFCVYFWATTPVIVSCLTFTFYVLIGNTLTASRIFTSIALFNLLIVPLNAFPWVLNGLIEAYISLKRIEAFLKLPDLDLNEYYSEPKSDGVIIEMEHATFTPSVVKSEMQQKKKLVSDLSTNEEALLELGPLNISFLKDQFVCIFGKVGSGKSTLLSAILADVPKTEGSVYFSALSREKGVGFIPQEPWIMQASVRENITFGKPMDYVRYHLVLEACALLDDIKVLPYGDKTEVGEKGITLSGGQKARIALARAVYQDLDLYLLDDPLAAVDVHVAEHLLNNCVLGLLKTKTCIMCTHRMNLLEKADVVVFLKDGRISDNGSQNIMSQHFFMPSSNENVRDVLEIKNPFGKNDILSLDDSQITSDDFMENNLIQEEEKDTGVVKFSVYLSYWNAIGSKFALFVLFSCFFMQALKTLSDWWLSFWISSMSEKSCNNSHIYSDFLVEISITKNSSVSQDVSFYLYIYGGITVANSIFTICRAFSFAYCGVKAAAILHRNLKASIFQAPLSFFCITPIGRILNRFSSDVYNVDDSLPFVLNIFLAQLFGLLGCVIVTCYSLPFIIVLLLPLSLCYYYLQRYYRRTSRELKRIYSITLSPIYAHFSETLNGQSTIRALRASPRFCHQNMNKLDTCQAAAFATMAASHWLNLHLQFIGVIVVSGVALIAVLENQFGNVDPGLVGLALSYALSVTTLLNGVVTSFTETEKEIVSVERVMQYIKNIPVEKKTSLTIPFFTWPSRGVIEFKNVCLKYSFDGPYALEDICFITKPAEKLGIVGRTGSGKSSLIQALFRMVEVNSGQIAVDDVEISRICQKELRSHLAVVPQDPFLFSGSIRENLDPRNIFSDYDIINALAYCKMDEKVRNLGGLQVEVEEGGRNFSVGERQLICLARTVLQRAKILCLDEATASIDQQTDNLVQHTIRMAFKNTTTLIIAHRIETVMDCDRVMVMKKGRIIELDKPSVLLSNFSSEFYKLVYNISLY